MHKCFYKTPSIISIRSHPETRNYYIWTRRYSNMIWKGWRKFSWGGHQDVIASIYRKNTSVEAIWPIKLDRCKKKRKYPKGQTKLTCNFMNFSSITIQERKRVRCYYFLEWDYFQLASYLLLLLFLYFCFSFPGYFLEWDNMQLWFNQLL